MAQRRTVAFCLAVITFLFVVACIPAVSEENKPYSENPLPLSLAAPVAERMYFLPPYDEAASFTPAKRLYYLPVSYEIQEAREISGVFADCEVFGQASDLYCIESITPRAP